MYGLFFLTGIIISNLGFVYWDCFINNNNHLLSSNLKDVSFDVVGNKIQSIDGTKTIGIKPTKESDIEIGDIIVFNDKKGNLVNHRVVGIVNYNGTTHYKTKGDNNGGSDHPLVEFNQIEHIIIGLLYIK